jgi:hypothetical protein
VWIVELGRKDATGVPMFWQGERQGRQSFGFRAEEALSFATRDEAERAWRASGVSLPVQTRNQVRFREQRVNVAA